jgi:hypothetical protein
LWQPVYLLLACEQRKRDGLSSWFVLRQTAGAGLFTAAVADAD